MLPFEEIWDDSSISVSSLSFDFEYLPPHLIFSHNKESFKEIFRLPLPTNKKPSIFFGWVRRIQRRRRGSI